MCGLVKDYSPKRLETMPVCLEARSQRVHDLSSLLPDAGTEVSCEYG